MSVSASPSYVMKPSRIKAPLPILITIVSTFALFVLFSTETISFLSSNSSIFRPKSCSRRDNGVSKLSEKKKDVEESSNESLIDDRFEFDPEECSVVNGKWVFNRSIKPLYTDRTCPYLERQVSCVRNGRPDTDYRHWEWQPDDCILPRFNPEIALKKLRGKRILFVGDSLQRGQWQSFVCLVESIIPEEQKSMTRGGSHSVFKAKKYDASIEFYWAPYLVESNSDIEIIPDPKQRILKVDSVSKHAKYWKEVDILVFNTYVWWKSTPRIKSLWGSFMNGEDGYEEFDTPIAYTIALKTWANWVDSTINPNKTRVFFTTISPTHMRSADWGNKNGTKCYNETKPVAKRKFRGSGSDKRMMNVVDNIVQKMKVPVTIINITQISDYRIDAHSSIYTENGGKLLTDEEKADPLHYADCIHWCLPGVPDTWNQIFLAYL